MQHDNVLKKVKFEFLSPSAKVVGRGGVCGQNICYNVAVFPHSLEFYMQHDHVLNRLNFDLLTRPPGLEVGGALGKIFAAMLLHL